MDLKHISHKNILKLLEHNKTNSFEIICSNLGIQLYIEDSTTTICGNHFVLDIYEHGTINQIGSKDPCTEICKEGEPKKSRRVDLSFVDPNMFDSFKYVVPYLNICLEKKDMKTFYLLLNFFNTFDTFKESNNQKNKALDQIKIIRSENNAFKFCECLYNENNFCISDSFENICNMGSSYNIFTHRFEMTLAIKSHIFQFPLIGGSFTFLKKKFLANNNEKIKTLEKKIEKNYIFYRHIDIMSKKGLKGTEEDEALEINCNDQWLEITQDLNVFFLSEKSRSKNPEMSFMVKKGVLIKDAYEYLFTNLFDN